MLCTKVCPVGQFIYSSECSCQSCSDKYGNECLSCTDKKCKTCSVGNFVENGSCVSCKTKDNNCLECENLTGKCTKCIEGYDVEDGICEHHIEN